MKLRQVAVALAGAAVLSAAPAVAHADPPGPTDYRSTVVGVEPAVPGMSVTIVGGDSFLSLTAPPGSTVEVAGYQGEPYVEFLPDGAVRENRASPSWHMSRERTGSPVPTGVTADSPPDWVRVAGDGTYAWHDHRAHWMSPDRPLGHSPGDVVWEGVVPLVVDGRPVRISVETVWLPEPSSTPLVIGALVGLGGAAAMVALGRRRPVLLAALAEGWAAVAFAVGLIGYLSVPAYTGPARTPLLLAAAAMVAAGVAAALYGGPSSPTRRLYADGALAVAGGELLLWSFGRRAGLTAAVLPTNLPNALDRGATVGVAAAALGALALAAWALGEAVSRPPTSRPAG